jgi:RNA polymerase sigma factor (sigma-70 family)
MQAMDDMALLREYAARNSEAAFETLVSRRVNFVYSAALRQVRNPHLAEEVTQAVFIILAQKAGRISDQTILTGWLFKTTRFAALAQIRAVARRQRHEQEAQMQSELQPSAPDLFWEQMSPLLDEALATLGETDRQAVLLRFFENKSLAEVGSSLGTGEDTARKRVSRAVEKLHRYFSKRGVSSTTAIIAGTISANSVQVAPAALAKSVTAVAIAKGAAASGSTLTLIQGALKIMVWAKAKIVASGVGVLLVLGTTTGIVLQLDIPHRLALAEGRRAIANHIAEPLDLTAYYDTLASNYLASNYRAIPLGFQTFAHVPLQIDGSKCLFGAGYPQYGGSIGDPQLLGIPVNRKFETLYVYHTAIFSSRNNTPVYELVFRYEDGDSVTNLVKYGADVLDWYANTGRKVIGPTGRNSQLAWHGDYVADGKTQPLRFSLTALNNPRPSVQVASIDLYSSKNASCGLILAMTTGKSGLMR